ncbi:MAG TPA: squalene synthase HpnC [Burkholderiaceae bacterium]|nr:squalene synthase HpnC [Burkholderiaceae bacterium]
MAVDHYENFPVASLLLPRELREAVRDIYRFARTADDVADEGDATTEERLAALAEFRRGLDILQGCSPTDLPLPHPHIFVPLAATMARHNLEAELFRDLISAFEQDVVKHRYESDAELLDYCRRSANPVGRLLLQLYDRHREDNLEYSDAICTGLQLTNFWQDVAVDWRKGRIYLPRTKLEQFGVSEDWMARCIEAGKILNSGKDTAASQAWHRLMAAQVAQARALLLQGRPLTRRMPFRAGLELRLVVQGGLLILERIEQLHYDVFQRRPVLRTMDWPRMALRALFH